MKKRFILITTIILSSSLYSQATTTGTIKLINGRVYPNAKVVLHNKDKNVIAEFECGKRNVFKESEISEIETKPLTRWKTQEECNYTGEDVSKWSVHQGNMNWMAAKAKCTSIGMRLPTIDELVAAHKAGAWEKWQKGANHTHSAHWTSREYSERAYFVDMSDGNVYDSFKVKGYDGNVRCVR